MCLPFSVAVGKCVTDEKRDNGVYECTMGRNTAFQGGLPIHMLSNDQIARSPGITIINLSDSHRKELEGALQDCKGIDFDSIQKTTFPLPTLGSILEAGRDAVHSNKDVIVIRGLEPATYCREDNVILYLGIASYFGEQRGRQTPDGNKLVHVSDVDSARVSRLERRPVCSNVAIPFHTDTICHVLALYCLSPAQCGGDLLLARTDDVYDALASSRPDLISVLAEPTWLHDDFSQDHVAYHHPLLYAKGSSIVMNFSPPVPVKEADRALRMAAKATPQAEALSAVETAARMHSAKLRLLPGDMCFINNLGTLHSRTAFDDDDKVYPSQRHLLRLWLSSHECASQLPQGLHNAWQRRFAPLDQIDDHYELEPIPCCGGSGSDTGFACHISDGWDKPPDKSNSSGNAGSSSQSGGGQQTSQGSKSSANSSATSKGETSGTGDTSGKGGQGQSGQPGSRLGGTGD